jgi:hypothetical protein
MLPLTYCAVYSTYILELLCGPWLLPKPRGGRGGGRVFVILDKHFLFTNISKADAVACERNMGILASLLWASCLPLAGLLPPSCGPLASLSWASCLPLAGLLPPSCGPLISLLLVSKSFSSASAYPLLHIQYVYFICSLILKKKLFRELHGFLANLSQNRVTVMGSGSFYQPWV